MDLLIQKQDCWKQFHWFQGQLGHLGQCWVLTRPCRPAQQSLESPGISPHHLQGDQELSAVGAASISRATNNKEQVTYLVHCIAPAPKQLKQGTEMLLTTEEVTIPSYNPFFKVL